MILINGIKSNRYTKGNNEPWKPITINQPSLNEHVCGKRPANTVAINRLSVAFYFFVFDIRMNANQQEIDTITQTVTPLNNLLEIQPRDENGVNGTRVNNKTKTKYLIMVWTVHFYARVIFHKVTINSREIITLIYAIDNSNKVV